MKSQIDFKHDEKRNDNPHIPLTSYNDMSKIAILIIWLKEMAMRKTTVMINDNLLEKAIAAIGARTKKEAIEAGLRSLIQQHNREALREDLGTFDIDLTLEELERLRNAE